MAFDILPIKNGDFIIGFPYTWILYYPKSIHFYMNNEDGLHFFLFVDKCRSISTIPTQLEDSKKNTKKVEGESPIHNKFWLKFGNFNRHNQITFQRLNDKFLISIEYRNKKYDIVCNKIDIPFSNSLSSIDYELTKLEETITKKHIESIWNDHKDYFKSIPFQLYQPHEYKNAFIKMLLESAINAPLFQEHTPAKLIKIGSDSPENLFFRIPFGIDTIALVCPKEKKVTFHYTEAGKPKRRWDPDGGLVEEIITPYTDHTFSVIFPSKETYSRYLEIQGIDGTTEKKQYKNYSVDLSPYNGIEECFGITEYSCEKDTTIEYE